MSIRTLISATELMALQPPLVILDCSFDLADPGAGERAFAGGKLPGARYLHLERDLCGPKTGRNGRHPLPARTAWAATAGALGIQPGTLVVAYDAQGGPYAAHAWWMLRWLGHDAVAVLDGGLAAWQAAGGALVTGPVDPSTSAAPYPDTPPLMTTVDAPELLESLGRVRLIDARAPERFRGDSETLDPVAGHVPGASNRFFKNNLQPDGRFKAAAQLRAEFEALGAALSGVIHQCGSGITACHNLLAMAHAGGPTARLYHGSWSEWCADPARPVAKG
jgi:thiosulfate/3-mercaptopyruvate sulfurtransferase